MLVQPIWSSVLTLWTFDFLCQLFTKANKNIGSQRDCQVKGIVVSHFFMYTWSLDLFNNASGARSIQYGLSVGKTGKKSLISGSGFWSCTTTSCFYTDISIPSYSCMNLIRKYVNQFHAKMRNPWNLLF